VALLAKDIPEHHRVGVRLQSLTPIFSSRACSFSELCPAAAMPVRSPLTSAINTGTPISENDSASFCRVTVLPVPVAPVISPWRLAIAAVNERVIQRARNQQG
jgi:hypothetical protein